MLVTRFGASRLAIAEISFIAFVVLLTFASDVFLPFALLLLLIVAALHLARRIPLNLVLPNPAWSALALIAMSLASLLITTQPQITQIQIARLFVGMLTCASVTRAIRMAGHNATEQTARRALFLALGSFVLLGLIFALASPLIVDWEGASKFSFLPRDLYSIFTLKTSDSVNPNVMAGMLILLTPLAAALVLYWGDLKRVLGKRMHALLSGMSLLMTVLSSIILLMMQSRGAMLGFISSIAVLVLLRWKRSRIVVATLVLLSSMGLLTTLVLRNPVTLNGILLSVLGFGQRIDIWARGMLLIQDFPLTGIGMGSFKSVTSLLYPLTLEYHEVPHAHNLFLQVAVDLGIPGLIAWLGILTNVILACITLIRSREPHLRAAGAGLLASNVALCVHGLTDAVTWGMVRTAPLVWALWGLALGAAMLGAHPTQKTPQSSAGSPPPAPSPELPPSV